jgi:hypothetical protein
MYAVRWAGPGARAEGAPRSHRGAVLRAQALCACASALLLTYPQMRMRVRMSEGLRMRTKGERGMRMPLSTLVSTLLEKQGR